VKPEKLTFTPMSKDLKSKSPSFQVLFNPNSYSITKTVTWNQTGASTPTPAAGAQSQAEAAGHQIYLDAPTLNFGGGGSRQLTLNLFFDVTETPGADVRTETGKIVALTKKDRKEKCPLPCEISWGKNSDDFPFIGVITSLTQNFVLFDGDGKPLRANLTVVLTEYPDPEMNQRQTDPELTTRVVRSGDTVSSIAGEVYGDPTLWRTIAEANGLDDPRRLQAGARLTIPKTG